MVPEGGRGSKVVELPVQCYTHPRMTRYYFIDTMGCQMNERDSETVAGIVEQLGYRPTDDRDQADFIALNTCAVRAKPQHKLFSKLGELRRIKEQRPHTIIAVLGCVAQVAAQEIAQRAPYVDIIIGPRNYSHLTRAITAAQARADNNPVIVTDTAEVIPEELPAARIAPISSYVNVTYGCNNFCAYCIVPYARGRQQSRAPEQIVSEVEQAVATGRQEVTLLGQNVNSYGEDLPAGCDFADLLTELNRVAGLKRIRFTTSHPKDLSLKLLDAMAELPKVCEHLHLPIQSGDDQVLERMGRGYTYEHYRRLIEAARERMPQVSITADVMVGFPGETEAQFGNTLRAFREIRFDQAFMFKYSDRPGTRAAQMESKVPEKVKQQRLEQLIACQNEIGHQINKELVGATLEVLVEGRDAKSPEKVRGRTGTNKIVIFPGGSDLQGQIVEVKAKQAFLWGFLGEAVGEAWDQSIGSNAY